MSEPRNENDKSEFSRSQLFTVRMWLEQLGRGRTEWRGKVQHILSGQARYFRDWQTLTAIMQEMLPNPTISGRESSSTTHLKGGENMYLVVGATGNLGGAIAHLLLAKGNSVRVLARPYSNYKLLVDAGAHVVFGDLKDRTSLDPACKGIQVVITTANSALRGGNDNAQTVDLEGNRNLIDAAKAAGVQQFIFVSALGADANSPVPFVAAKGKTEEYLGASGVPYTILAPNAFMDFWIGVYVGVPALQRETVTLAGEGNRKHSFIAAADVVQFTIAAIGNPAAINQRLMLGGPQPFSLRDAVKVYEQVLGKTIPVQSVRPGEPVSTLPENTWGLAASLEMFDSPIEMTETARKFGVPLTSLEEFVRRSVANK